MFSIETNKNINVAQWNRIFIGANRYAEDFLIADASTVLKRPLPGH
jgi:hypothetical protein